MRAHLLLLLAAVVLAPPSSPAVVEKPIYESVRSGDLAALRRWISSGRSVRFLEPHSGFRLLHVAADAGQLEAVRLLLDAGVELFDPTPSGWTALELACERGNLPLVEELLMRGFSPDGGPDMLMACMSSEARLAPLHVAADAGHERIVRFLLERGAAAAARDSHGQTALHHAVMHERMDVIRQLLADDDRRVRLLEAEDEVGWRPLHVAAAYGRLDALALLLSHGASPAALSQGGFEPADLAVRFRHPAALAVLVDARGDGAGPEPSSDEAWIVGAALPRPRGVDSEDPALVLVHRIGNPGPAPARSGLQLALWSDGALLFAPRASEPGENLALISIGAATAREVLALLWECGSTRVPARTPGSPDSSTDSLYFDRDDRRVEESWEPGRQYEDRLRADECFEFRGFLASLMLARELFDRLRSLGGTPLDPVLEEGRFRRYDPDHPWGTPWMHGR